MLEAKELLEKIKQKYRPFGGWIDGIECARCGEPRLGTFGPAVMKVEDIKQRMSALEQRRGLLEQRLTIVSSEIAALNSRLDRTGPTTIVRAIWGR